MKKLWILCNRTGWKKDTKNKIFTSLWTLIVALIGGILWMLMGSAFSTYSNATEFVAFVGYPSMILGFFGAIFYLCNHDFA